LRPSYTIIQSPACIFNLVIAAPIVQPAGLITIFFVNKPLVLRGRGFSKTGALMMAAWSNGRYFISSVGSVAIGRVLVGGAAALARRN
jgi:hypothetical protein